MSKETGTQAAFERSAAIFMAFVSAISLLAATGWLFNQPVLASLRSEYIPMVPITLTKEAVPPFETAPTVSEQLVASLDQHQCNDTKQYHYQRDTNHKCQKPEFNTI